MHSARELTPLERCQDLAQRDHDQFIVACNAGAFDAVSAQDLFPIIKNSKGNKLKEFALTNNKPTFPLSPEHLDEIAYQLHPDKDMLQRLLFLLQLNGSEFSNVTVTGYLRLLTFRHEQFKRSPYSQIQYYFDMINNFIKNLDARELAKIENNLCHILITLVKIDLTPVGVQSMLEEKDKKLQRAMRVLVEYFEQTKRLEWSKERIVTLFECLSAEKMSTASILVNLDIFRYWIAQYRGVDNSSMPLATVFPQVFTLLTNDEIKNLFSAEEISDVRFQALTKDMPQIKALIEHVNLTCSKSGTSLSDRSLRLLFIISQLKHCYQLSFFPEKWRHDMPEIINRATIFGQALRCSETEVDKKKIEQIEQAVLLFVGTQSEENEHQLRIRILEYFMRSKRVRLALRMMKAWDKKWNKDPDTYLLFRLGEKCSTVKNMEKDAIELLTTAALLGNEAAVLFLLEKKLFVGDNIQELMGKVLHAKFQHYLESTRNEECAETLETYCNYFFQYGLQEAYNEQFKKYLEGLSKKLETLIPRYLAGKRVLSDILQVRQQLKRFIPNDPALVDEKMVVPSNTEIVKRLQELKTKKSDAAVKKACASLHLLYQLKMDMRPDQASSHHSIDELLIAWLAAAKELLTHYIKNVLADKHPSSEDSLAMIKTCQQWLQLPELQSKELTESMPALVTDLIKNILKFELDKTDVCSQPDKLKEITDNLYQVLSTNETNQDSYRDLRTLCLSIIQDPFNQYFQLDKDHLAVMHVQLIYDFAIRITKVMDAPPFEEKKEVATTRLRREIFRTLFANQHWSYPVPFLQKNCVSLGLDSETCHDFSKLSLTQIQLTMSTFTEKTNFDHTDFLSSGFTHCVFAHCSFKQTSFIKANLERSDFSFASLKKANFTDANLQGVIVIGADLTDIIISEENALTLLIDNLQKISNLQQLDESMTDYKEKGPDAGKNALATELFYFLFSAINSKEALTTLKSKLMQLYSTDKLTFLKNTKEVKNGAQPSAARTQSLFGIFSSSTPIIENQNRVFDTFIMDIDNKLLPLKSTPKVKKAGK